MQYRIRDYKTEDYQDVLKIWQVTGLGGAMRGDDEHVINRTLLVGGRLLIMENTEGEIIGTSWMTNDGRRLYLHHFGIKPAWQGKGLANMLLQESLEVAKEKGLQIKLEVHQNNTIAAKLYKKFGFSWLGDYHVYIIRNLHEINE